MNEEKKLDEKTLEAVTGGDAIDDYLETERALNFYEKWRDNNCARCAIRGNGCPQPAANPVELYNKFKTLSTAACPDRA